MAQIILPDQEYATLAQLAALHENMTPEGYMAGVIAGRIDIEQDRITLDQRAYWGSDIEERIERSLARLEAQPDRKVMTDEEFLTSLEGKEPDADV